MSVTATAAVAKVTSFQRGSARPLTNPLGYWGGQNSVAGDASGGIATLALQLGIRGYFGGKSFFDVRYIWTYCSGSLVNPYAYFSITPSDYSPLPTLSPGLDYLVLTLTAGGLVYNSQHVIPNMLWALDKSGTTATVSFDIAPNTDARTFYIGAGGYIYSEELLTGLDIN